MTETRGHFRERGYFWVGKRGGAEGDGEGVLEGAYREASRKFYKIHNCACNLLNGFLKMTVTEFPNQSTTAAERRGHDAAEDATCYSVTIFTNRWREMRDFYVDILNAEVMSERPDRYCEMKIGGVPLCLRRSECGEMTSYFHLYLT